MVFDNAPIFLIEEGRNIVKLRSFVGPKLKHSRFKLFPIDFSLQEYSLVMVQFRDREKMELFEDVLKFIRLVCFI